jgi:hypothetical protein
MYAECMLRCISHNVACLVQAVEEFKIEPKYWAPATNTMPSLGAGR